MIHDFRDDQIFVTGTWRKGRGVTIRSDFAAERIPHAAISGASFEDVDEAIERARAAQSDPGWRALKPHECATYLNRISDGIAANIDRIAWIQRRDTSKTLSETRALAASASATFRHFGAVLETADERLPVPRGDYQTMSVHDPLGVVAAITPWNSPIASDAQKIGARIGGWQRGRAETRQLVAISQPGTCPHRRRGRTAG